MILIFSDLEQREVYLIDGFYCLPIPEYPNYLAAKVGKLYSIPRTKTRGGWLKGKRRDDGYIEFGIFNKDTSRSIFLHQAVLLAWRGLCPEGQECRHLDDDKPNNALWNLEYGTDAQNKRERGLNGKTSRGENHSRSKCSNPMTDDEVRAIRRRLTEVPSYVVCEEFGRSKCAVSKIKNRVLFGHIE